MPLTASILYVILVAYAMIKHGRMIKQEHELLRRRLDLTLENEKDFHVLRDLDALTHHIFRRRLLLNRVMMVGSGIWLLINCIIIIMI